MSELLSGSHDQIDLSPEAVAKVETQGRRPLSGEIGVIVSTKFAVGGVERLPAAPVRDEHTQTRIARLGLRALRQAGYERDLIAKKYRSWLPETAA